jgi:lipoyl(octanoyl) transferase
MAIAEQTAVKSQTKTPAKKRQRVFWHIDDRPVPYDRALGFMDAKVNMIREKAEDDYIWLLEHPPVYTAGTSAEAKDMLNPRFPVYNAGRGGQYTYHGPGQRVAYVMLDLQRRSTGAGPDLKTYIRDLEEWIIRALAHFDVKGERREGRVGIWVDMEPYDRPKGTEAKIAAIGVRVRKWVAFHGVAINVSPDLSHYSGIVPCGIAQHGVTSLADLGIKTTMAEMDKALKASWEEIFD